MTLTSSLIILALSFFTITSAVVLPRAALEANCAPVFDPNDGSSVFPQIVSPQNDGALVVNRTADAPVTNTAGGGGDQIKVIASVQDPSKVVFVLAADPTLSIAAKNGFLVTASFDETDTSQMFGLGCRDCRGNNIVNPTVDSPAFAQFCQITPAINPNNVCATIEGDKVSVTPCTGSTEQLFNLVVT